MNENLNKDFKDESSDIFQIYTVNVENLRVRAEESKHSKVIGKLKEGSLVRGQNFCSSKKDKITLRGVVYNEPYCKVTTNSDVEGWVYAGGLNKIYESHIEDSFTEELDNLILDYSNFKESGLSIGYEVMNKIVRNRSQTPEWNDILYKLSYEKLKVLEREDELYKMLDSISWSEEDYRAIHDRSYDMNSTELSKRFLRAGLMFDAQEGMVYQMVNIEKLQSVINGPFSQAMTEYLSMEIRNSKKKFFSDAALVAPISEILDVIIARELFLTRNPIFIFNVEIKKELEYLHLVLLKGTANTPARDFEHNRVKKEWVQAWKKYQSILPQGMIFDAVEKNMNKLKN